MAPQMEVQGTGVSSKISAGDLFWWRIDEPVNPMVINVLLGVPGPLTPAELRDTLRPHVVDNLRMQAVPKPTKIGGWRPYFCAALLATVIAVAILRCYVFPILSMGLVIGFLLESYLGQQWKWEKVSGFALEEYVKLHTLESDTAECLHQFIDEVASTQLPRDKAQWMVWVLHNVPGGGTKLLFRFHHVVADGAGLGLWFFKMCLSEEQQKADEAARKDMINKVLADRKAKRKGGLKGMAKVMATIDSFVLRVLVIMSGILKMLILMRDSNSMVKGPKLGKKRTAIPSPSLTFSVEEVKRIGKSVSPATTVNDTMCALIGGAFARYYQARGLHPEQMMMRVTMPINTRSPKAPIQMENAFTVVFKSLPLHLPTPPGEDQPLPCADGASEAGL